MKKIFIALVLIASTACQALADSFEQATSLGSVIASEEFCKLNFDQQAISYWIDKNVDPADMSFPSLLNTMTTGSAYMHQEMSESSKTAHCRSIERIAKNYGFIE